MSVVISGALIDGAGIPMSGCHIILKSRVNTSEVVMRTVADVVTGNCGEYCFKAQTGKYCVYLKQDWRDEYCVGDIAVYDDSKPGTLNDFLTALDEGDLKPDVVKRFEEMVAQAQQSAEAAAESERQAGQHVAAAQKIKEDCQTLADNVQQSAEAVAEDKNQVALLASSATQDAARAEQAVKDADTIVRKAVDKLADAATLTGEAKASAEAAAKSEQNTKEHADSAEQNAQQTAQDVTATETARDDAERFAENARQDAVATAEDRKATAEDVKRTGANAAAAGQCAQDAAGYARAAEQAKNDIDVTLAGTLKTVNHLSEIAAAGTEAQQESRDNLGLRVAATMEPQDGTHDRAEGRLAVPGMFGFGKVFLSRDKTEFKTGADFLRWVKTAKPGRYTVFADTNVVVPGIQTNGVIEIIWPQPKGSADDRAYKAVIYYGVNGQIYYNRYVGGQGYLAGWENLKVDEASLRALIETRAPLNSPAFTGTPTTPTPPDDAAGLETANAAFVRKLLAALVDSSPEALDTLNELATALGNDPNFAATITNALAGKQPLNDVLTAISKLTQRADNLLCFNQDGEVTLSPLSEKARSLLAQTTAEAIRTELELAASATMDVQTDIYDRTADCLALPGAFGYGHLFSSSEVVYFSEGNGPAEFLKWVFQVTPGRYAVTQYGGGGNPYNPIIARDGGKPYFRGLVDIEIRNGWSATEDSRWITFHGDAEYEGGFGEGPAKYQVRVYKSMSPSALPKAWSRLFVSPKWLTGRLYAGNGTDRNDPLPGSLVLAAYLPEKEGESISLLRAQGVQGSRLRQVVFEAEYRSSGFSATPRSFVYGNTLSGSYVALSGGPTVTFSKGVVSLFVRVS